MPDRREEGDAHHEHAAAASTIASATRCGRTRMGGAVARMRRSEHHPGHPIASPTHHTPPELWEGAQGCVPPRQRLARRWFALDRRAAEGGTHHERQHVASRSSADGTQRALSATPDQRLERVAVAIPQGGATVSFGRVTFGEEGARAMPGQMRRPRRSTAASGDARGRPDPVTCGAGKAMVSRALRRRRRAPRTRMAAPASRGARRGPTPPLAASRSPSSPRLVERCAAASGGYHRPRRA